MSPEQARRVLAEADLIHSAQAVNAALERVAAAITQRLENDHPLVLTVMGGAVVFAGQLIPRLPFPLECDYVHASRYGRATHGGEIHWVRDAHAQVAGRNVLLVDDILDEGITLAAIKARLLEHGAAHVLTAVLADKELGRTKPITADFVGLTLPNRYVFGCGMDVEGAWRNLPAIYALKASHTL
jgi:hypoxanthine phosphoribosyltransferase